MNMHSRYSLHHGHGVVIPGRRRRPGGWTSTMLAGIRGFLRELKRVIEGELAVRQAIVELREMNDHMLRDIGITRTDIERVLRQPDAGIETDEALSRRIQAR